MVYEQFIDYVRESIVEVLGGDFRVSVHKVIKNNDIELDALTITESENCISPTIYLTHYFNEYEEGRDLFDIVNDIITLYEEHKGKLEFDTDFFKEFDLIKDKIAYKVINAAGNQKLLQDVPYIPLLDLAIVFYCLIESDFTGSATALIHHSHLKLWNIDITQLYNVAYENTPRMLKYELKDMNEIIKEMFLEDLIKQRTFSNSLSDDSYEEGCMEHIVDEMATDFETNKVPMYVLTNEQKINGAACMLYQGVLEEFALREEEDLYILPSSIHEVIIVPATSDISKEQLDLMVKQVNEEEVAPGDILSDHVYFYRRGTGQICM